MMANDYTQQPKLSYRFVRTATSWYAMMHDDEHKLSHTVMDYKRLVFMTRVGGGSTTD